ncbi:hypothetical protein DPEC_G00023600 [Dallia pectoralis]|uniref:Uncharacterized protein n=1 Tax=Dallia pectoralis TaxID=75939 RepID=A0ACC2HGU5_DALPE|nr:hypothetical protein DPEC_G00023600 [Dallia pectoralis]
MGDLRQSTMHSSGGPIENKCSFATATWGEAGIQPWTSYIRRTHSTTELPTPPIDPTNPVVKTLICKGALYKLSISIYSLLMMTFKSTIF